MSKADIDELGTLHGALARKLSELLEEVDGDTKGAAAVLNVARQFLKDNNVDADPAPGSDLARLHQKATQYPFDPEEASVN